MEVPNCCHDEGDSTTLVDRREGQVLYLNAVCRRPDCRDCGESPRHRTEKALSGERSSPKPRVNDTTVKGHAAAVIDGDLIEP